MKPQISTVVAFTLFAAMTAAHADVVISAKPTQNMNCQAGVCTPTAPKAVLNATDLANMLAGGDVKVTTGSGAADIVVKAAFSWTSANRLTLDAIQSVEIDKPVMVTGTGAVTIMTNDGGTGGDLIFDGKGNVTFWDLNNSLIVNGNNYTLVDDIATLASDIANNPSGFYALANDYDASVDGTYPSAPVTTIFHGIFEGLGHAISDLKIDSPDFEVGLFAEVFGTLRDVGLRDVSIHSTGSGNEVGSLLATSEMSKIIGCYATGSVVVGNAFGSGGLVGVSSNTSDGTMVRSHATATVSGGDGAAVGGLVGVSGFTITLSYATGRVKAGNNTFAGGLLGSAVGNGVSQGYATGDVIAGENSNVGGLIGSSGGSTIKDSYATGAVKGGAHAIVGGLGGFIVGTHLEFSYSTGLVKGGISNGGFLGDAGGSDTFGSDYWDVDTSGKGKGAGIGICHDNGCRRAVKGLATEEFQLGLPAGFDPNIWREKKSINNGYPYLIANPPPQ